MPSAEQFTVYTADLDSCSIPMTTMELIRLFPSMQMASLVNYPVPIKDLKEMVCVADFGYKIFIPQASMKTKTKVARRFRDLGVTINTHESEHAFTSSRIPVGLHVLVRTLMGGGIKLVILVVYGMKIPLAEVQALSSIHRPSIPAPSKFDIGVNVDLPFIPLFKISPGYKGTIYPMLLSQSGSAFMKLNVTE